MEEIIYEMTDSHGDEIAVDIGEKSVCVSFEDLESDSYVIMQFNKEKLNEFIQLLKKASEKL